MRHSIERGFGLWYWMRGGSFVGIENYEPAAIENFIENDRRLSQTTRPGES